jgi:hypothetical protein
MEVDSIYTVIATALSVLFSAGAWRYYERRIGKKETYENFIRDECRERIAKLEVLLEKSSREKDEMRSTIITLSSQVAELRVKVEYLEEENADLHKSIRKKKNLDE